MRERIWKITKVAVLLVFYLAVGFWMNVFTQPISRHIPPPIGGFTIALIVAVIATCWPIFLIEASREWKTAGRLDRIAMVGLGMFFSVIGGVAASASLMGKSYPIQERFVGYDEIGFLVGGVIAACLWVWHSFVRRA